MASRQSDQIFGADELEDMCKKGSEEYQTIKAKYQPWCVDHQQKRQIETQELEGELGRLKKCLTDAELEEERATQELTQLLSRPWLQRDGTPDIDELLDKADRRNMELRRLREKRDRAGGDKKTILRQIETIQNKLQGLPQAYAVIKKDETRRLREQLEDLWQRSSQPDSFTNTNDLPGVAAQRQKELTTGAFTFAAEGLPPVNSAASYEQRRECSREASIETISSTEFKQSIFPQRPDLHPSPNQSRARSDTASRCPNFAGAANDSGISMIKPQTRLSNPSPNQVAIFRDSQGPYQSEGITHGKRKHRATAQEHQNADPASSPSFSRFGRLDKAVSPNAPAEGKHASKTTMVTAARSARREAVTPHDRTTTGWRATRRRSQVSISDSDPDLPPAKKRKAEKTVAFDEVNAENKDWRAGEKIYKMTDYPSGSNRWYIFPCKKHCTGFTSPRGAARHLERGGGHQYGHWTTPQAANELGVHVVDCDREKQQRNNDAFERAVVQGYRPAQRCNDGSCPVHVKISGADPRWKSAQRQQSEDLGDSDPYSGEAYYKMLKRQGGDAGASKAGQQRNPSPTVSEPIPGEIYQAYWASDHSWYPVAVLPWGDLGEVGLQGSLCETALFKEKLPTCFAVEESQDGPRIVGWKADFELHHRRDPERKFPCMFFEGISAVLPRDEESPREVENLAWVMARHLRPIDYRHPDGQNFKEAGLDEAKAFRERASMLKGREVGETPRCSPTLDDDDSDVAEDIAKPLAEHSAPPMGIKMEQDVESWL